MMPPEHGLRDHSRPSALAYLPDVAARSTRRCGIHGDDTSGGRCGSCDQVAYDQAEAHLEAERDAYEAACEAAYGGDQ